MLHLDFEAGLIALVNSTVKPLFNFSINILNHTQMKNAVNFKVSYSIKRNGVLECHNKTFSDILSAMEAVDKLVRTAANYISIKAE